MQEDKEKEEMSGGRQQSDLRKKGASKDDKNKKGQKKHQHISLLSAVRYLIKCYLISDIQGLLKIKRAKTKVRVLRKQLLMHRVLQVS